MWIQSTNLEHARGLEIPVGFKQGLKTGSEPSYYKAKRLIGAR